MGEEWEEEWGNKINSWQVFEFVFVEKPTVNHSDTLEEKKKWVSKVTEEKVYVLTVTV